MDVECPVCEQTFEVAEPGPAEWAEAFYLADAVEQEQMLAHLRLVCPHLTISFTK